MLLYAHICIHVFPVDSYVLQYSMLFYVCDTVIACTLDCMFTSRLWRFSHTRKETLYHVVMDGNNEDHLSLRVGQPANPMETATACT